MHENKNAILGIIWIILFCLASTTADGIVRYVTMQGLPSSEMLFIRSFLGALILLPFVLKNRSIHNLTKKTFKLYAARGIFAFIGVSIWFYILQYTDFTALMAVGFTAPLFAAILSIMFLGEKASVIKIVALIIGFSGAITVINPFSITFNWYSLLGIVSTFLWAISIIFVKQLSSKENPITVAFFFALILTPLSFLLAVPVWETPTTAQWLLTILFTIIATFGNIALIKAYSHAELVTLLPFEFTQLLFAALFSYIVFGDLATLNTFLGGVIIFCSGYIIVRSERKKHRLEELQIIP